MRRIKIFSRGFLLLAAITMVLNGCATSSNTAKGAGIGAGVGAILGAVIGHQSKHKEEGALIGAATGAAIGGLIGRRMDKQAEELKQVEGVEDVSYDSQNQKISANLKILFDTNKANIKSAEAAKLDELAQVFSKYPENIVVLEGHTDSDGSADYNQQLSERRAGSVKTYLASKNLNIASLNSYGYGESQPIASNDTSAGKAQNRRVEIHISVDPSRVPQS